MGILHGCNSCGALIAGDDELYVCDNCGDSTCSNCIIDSLLHRGGPLVHFCEDCAKSIEVDFNKEELN